MSTSLPLDVQLQMYRSVLGLEEVEIMRPAYAIEYDYIPPTQITQTLETKRITGLYLAGQINGTSGTRRLPGSGFNGWPLMPPLQDPERGPLLYLIGQRLILVVLIG